MCWHSPFESAFALYLYFLSIQYAMHHAYIYIYISNASVCATVLHESVCPEFLFVPSTHNTVLCCRNHALAQFIQLWVL